MVAVVSSRDCLSASRNELIIIPMKIRVFFEWQSEAGWLCLVQQQVGMSRQLFHVNQGLACCVLCASTRSEFGVCFRLFSPASPCSTFLADLFPRDP